MSNRDSMGFGDLLPQDVVDIFAQEKHSRRGRKKRTRSLGRALGWLKGKKRKDHGANGQSLGLGPALDLALDGHPAGLQGGHKGGHKGGQKSGRQAHSHGNNHAVPKRDDDGDKTPAPPLFQENVFIEAPTRPKYLEDLHSEALEGLKMMQQEETNSGVEYQDNESTISTMSIQTDGEGGGFVTDSTIHETSSVVSVQSSVSTRSSRSGLTRQGSTFRPLNSGKKSEKTRTRRRHRKTVAGIPHHVQRELGLDRVGWTLTQQLEEELYGDSDHCPTSDGTLQAGQSREEATASHQVRRPLTKDAVKQQGATHAGHRDDLALLNRLGPDLASGPRPRSLAVPWMTTASSLQQDPPSPVMSMSPQAAYMSKIIPNAVLPPSIEVVEISRGQSRSSLRTVSKSSLLMSSPALSRASSRASSSRNTSSRASTITSASRHNPPNLSDSSCWSNSESSETLVSESSTISSSSTPRQIRSQNGDACSRDDKISVQSSISKTSKCTSNGKLIIKGDEVKKDGQFVRSLSVMKSKRAPLPPSRSYSLHSKMKRRSRDLAEVKVISGEPSLHRVSAPGQENEKNKSGSSPMSCSTVDSPGYNADTSSLEDSTGSLSLTPVKYNLQVPKTEDAEKDAETVSKDAPQKKQEPTKENERKQIISPSSGYSSLDATSPLCSKQAPSSSPLHKKGILAKLHKLFPGSASAGSAPPVPPQTDPKPTVEHKPDSVDTASVSPSVRTLRELFNIPPHPKVHAPPPPPPEVWAHNKRTFELLLGPPAPDNTYAIIKKNPKDRRQQRLSPSGSIEGSVKSLQIERKHKNPIITVDAVNGSSNVQEVKKVEESGILKVEIHKESNERLLQNVDLNGNKKDEKGKVSDMLNGMLVEKRQERLAAMREEDTNKTSTQTTELKTHTDPSPAISLVRISPPVQPENRPTTDVVSTISQILVSPESSWPPPPPPMLPVGLSGPHEVDFPFPPPPMFAEEDLVLPVQMPPKTSMIRGDSSASVKTESVKVITSAEPQKPSMSQEVVPPPLNIPPPPPYSAPPPPVLPSTTNKISLPPKQASPPPRKENPPPQPTTPPPPPPADVLPVRPKESSEHMVQDVPTLLKDVSPALVTVLSTTPAEEVSPPQVIEVSLPSPEEVFAPSPEEIPAPSPEEIPAPSPEEIPAPSPEEIPAPSPEEIPAPSPEEIPAPSPEEIPAPSPEEVTPPLSEEDAPIQAMPLSKLTPPQSIPPPPPLPSGPQSSKQEIDLPQEKIPSEPESDPVSSNSVLLPLQSVPPPPPLQLLHQPQPQVVSPKIDDSETQENPPSPPSVISLSPSPETPPSPKKDEEPAPPPPPTDIPLPLQGLDNIKQQPDPLSTEDQNPEQTPASVPQEEPSPLVTPSLLQKVKLRSVNSSPEPPKSQEDPKSEVTMREQQPINQVPTSSASSDAPQKPIRRSLIVTSPISTSPPTIVLSQPALPKLLPPASSSTAASPMKKSSPAMTTSPSMNLQEAIRLRTAARSKAGPASRLSLHSPTSPMDLHKSPTSTASFIFSKSNKKLVIETRQEAKEDAHNNNEVSPVTKVISDPESLKVGAKVPPPVAKKPKTKGKEVETSEGTEQTAGQEAQQESVKDAAEKTNGTAGTVEGSST